MKLLIDVIAITGGLAVTAGVYLEWGTGFACIAGGSQLIALAIVAANVNGDAHVPDGQ